MTRPAQPPAPAPAGSTPHRQGSLPEADAAVPPPPYRFDDCAPSAEVSGTCRAAVAGGEADPAPGFPPAWAAPRGALSRADPPGVGPVAGPEVVAALAGGPVIVLHRGGPLPEVDPEEADLCLTALPGAPAPWVAVPDPVAAEARILRACAAQPVAAAVLLRLLRLTGGMAVQDALEVESLAFSALLGGAGFRGWLARRGPVAAPALLPDPLRCAWEGEGIAGSVLPPGPLRCARGGEAIPGSAALPDLLRFEREGEAVTLTMADPASHNALSARMRDALAAALDSCLIDPTRPIVTLTGGPRVFCSGGALAEFGLARDLGLAHLVRREQSVAGRLLALGPRARVVAGGAAIGAGAEIAAAAAHVAVRPGAWFRLPELAMGLIPGAGGTVTLPRRIGRHRACWLMLTGQRLGAAQAVDWGLADGLCP